MLSTLASATANATKAAVATITPEKPKTGTQEKPAENPKTPDENPYKALDTSAGNITPEQHQEDTKDEEITFVNPTQIFKFA